MTPIGAKLSPGPIEGQVLGSICAPCPDRMVCVPAVQAGENSVVSRRQNVHCATAPLMGTVHIPRGSTDNAGHNAVQLAQYS